MSTQSASSLRAFTSSLFGFFWVTISAFFLAPDVARRIAGTDEGTIYQWVLSVTWLLAAVFGGFVAGYRAAGRGAFAGLLCGTWTAIFVGGLFIVGIAYWLKDSVIGMLGVGGPREIFHTVTFRFGDQLPRLGVTLVLSVAIGAWGGLRGDLYYEEIGAREDPARHTLFAVPWWHWAWLLVFLPGFVISDCMLSGHLFVLATIAIFKHFLLGLVPLIGSLIQGSLYLVGALGLYAMFGGAVNLHDALAVDSGLTTGRRFAKATWGLFLIIVVVNVAWSFSSRFLVASMQ